MRPIFTVATLNNMIIKSQNKRIALWSNATGAVALIRAPDGQAYEVEVRPASLAKFQPFFRYTRKRNSEKARTRREAKKRHG